MFYATYYSQDRGFQWPRLLWWGRFLEHWGRLGRWWWRHVVLKFWLPNRPLTYNLHTIKIAEPSKTVRCSTIVTKSKENATWLMFETELVRTWGLIGLDVAPLLSSLLPPFQGVESITGDEGTHPSLGAGLNCCAAAESFKSAIRPAHVVYFKAFGMSIFCFL